MLDKYQHNKHSEWSGNYNTNALSLADRPYPIS